MAGLLASFFTAICNGCFHCCKTPANLDDDLELPGGEQPEQVLADVAHPQAPLPLLALGSFDATVSVWNYRTGECLWKFDNHDANGVVIFPDCQRMVMTVAEDQAQVLGLDGAQVSILREINLGVGAITTLVLDKSGRLLGAACEDGCVHMFETRTYEPKCVLRPPEARGFGMIMAAISPCGGYVAASGKQGRVWLWDQTQEHQGARKLEADLDKVTSLSFNYEATQLAVALRDHTVCVFCTKTRNELHRCCGHTGVVHSISFGPNGLLASGSRDGTAKLWRGAECIHTFLGHSGSVNAVSISPDGEFLATGSEDSTAKLWNLTRETYECSLTLEGHIAGLSVLAFASGV